MARIRYLRPELKNTLPRIGTKETNHFATVEETLEVSDARPAMAAGELSLDTNGFILTPHQTQCVDFRDEAMIRRVYYPEMVELVKRLTGAFEVVVQEHLVRTEKPISFNDAYSRFAHLDYNDRLARFTPKILASRSNKITREQAETDYEYAFFNTWQPFDRPVLQNHLALLDARTVQPDDVQDYIFTARPGQEDLNQGTATILCHNPANRWHYFPKMQTGEAILFKQLDLRDAQFRPQTPHIAFWDDTAPPDAPGRRSIEVRLLAAWPAASNGLGAKAAERLFPGKGWAQANERLFPGKAEKLKELGIPQGGKDSGSSSGDSAKL